MDLDCHQYMYATRTGVAKVYSHLAHLELNWGLVVEARKEEQMPEQMCTAIKLMRIDGKHADECVLPSRYGLTAKTIEYGNRAAKP